MWPEGLPSYALMYILQALKLDSNRPIIYDSRAAALEKLGKLGEALKDARKAIEISPGSAQVLFNSVTLISQYSQYLKGYIRCARLLRNAGKLNAALKMIDLALERITSSDDARRKA